MEKELTLQDYGFSHDLKKFGIRKNLINKLKKFSKSGYKKMREQKITKRFETQHFFRCEQNAAARSQHDCFHFCESTNSNRKQRFFDSHFSMNVFFVFGELG